MPSIRPNAARWPRNLDDMRADPSRLVTLADLARLGLVRSYDSAKKKLPAPLSLPTAPRCWEARTILFALNLPDVPTATLAPAAATPLALAA
jgi:hypothetical protein